MKLVFTEPIATQSMPPQTLVLIATELEPILRAIGWRRGRKMKLLTPFEFSLVTAVDGLLPQSSSLKYLARSQRQLLLTPSGTQLNALTVVETLWRSDAPSWRPGQNTVAPDEFVTPLMQ